MATLLSRATLPRSLDDLRGLRAARWIRESSEPQMDNFGPASQRDQQDRAIERYGMIDTGIAWQVAHSGKTVGGTPQFADMLARAGRDYDLLLVGYVSRFARDLETSVTARRQLHACGVALLFCDGERLLSSDEARWDEWARQAVEAESYSRHLSRRVQEGYAAKWRRYGDPGGQPPLGFKREPEKPHRLVLDRATIGRAVALFEGYATGTRSMAMLASGSGIHEDAIRDILRNPIYNGWVGRKRERQPGPWRDKPPVSDELWDRVEAVRRRNVRGGGPRRRDRVDLLAGLLYCRCGRMIRANGTTGGGHSQRVHPGACMEWGVKPSYLSATWLEALSAQVQQVRLNSRTIEAVVRALAQPAPRADELARQRLLRRRREAAEAFAAGRLAVAEFMATVAALDGEERSLQTAAQPEPAVDAGTAVAYLRNLPALWSDAGEQERSDLLHAIYAKVEVRGPEFLGVTLTPAAEAHGLALALPEHVGVSWRARPDSNRRSPA